MIAQDSAAWAVNRRICEWGDIVSFRVVPLCAALLLSIGQAQAGNWMRNQGESAYLASLDHSSSSSYWDRDGILRDSACRSDSTSLNQYYEYGYSYHYTVFAGASLEDRKCGTHSASGLGDVLLGIRGRLNPERNGETWELKMTLPTGYSRTVPVRLGYGRVGLEAGVGFRTRGEPYNREDPYQPSYARTPDSYWEYGASLRLWQGAPASQVGAYAKWTRILDEKWIFAAAAEGEFSLGDGKTENVDFVSHDRLPEYDVIRGMLEFKYLLDREWTVAISPKANLWGRNVGRSSGASVSIHRTWGK